MNAVRLSPLPNSSNVLIDNKTQLIWHRDPVIFGLTNHLVVNLLVKSLPKIFKLDTTWRLPIEEEFDTLLEALIEDNQWHNIKTHENVMRYWVSKRSITNNGVESS